MFLIPYDRLSTPLPLAVDEVERRISAHVDTTSPNYFWSNWSDRYGGRITRAGFVLLRTWPHLYFRIGIRVVPQEAGSLISVAICVPSLLIFPIVLATFLAYPTGQNRYVACANVVGICLLMCLFYFLEKRSLIRDLQRMLAGEPSL
jgi:hypothetical protein